MSAQAGPNPYRAVPIAPGERDIRLVRVLPGSSPAIRCQFVSTSLEACPPYVALSYTWGSPERTETIQLQNRACPVGQNLFAFLCRVSRDANDSLFWIDALCIDQANVQERNHQVRLMRDIYAGAARVVVWLGEASPQSYTTIHLIEAAYRDLMSRGGGGASSSSSSSSPPPPPGSNSPRSSILSAADRDHIAALFRHEYWSRVWIVQEIMCARELVIYWGKRTIRWECIAAVSDQLPAVRGLGASPAAVIIRSKAAWEGAVPLAHLVSEYIHLRSTDIRDKVFGLLGLASEDDPLQPDYDMKPVDVFEATCRVAFRSSSLSRFYDKMKFGRSLREALAVPFTEKRLGELARQQRDGGGTSSRRRSAKVQQRLLRDAEDSSATLARVEERAAKSRERFGRLAPRTYGSRGRTFSQMRSGSFSDGLC